MQSFISNPFFCPQYDLFKFVNEDKEEITQYCPATGRKISGSCSTEEVWFKAMCPECPRLSGIRPSPARKKKGRKPLQEEEKTDYLYLADPEEADWDD